MRHAVQVAAELKLDMAEYWQPTAAGYFGRVSKQQTLDAVAEAAGPGAKGSLSALKKADLAKAAEKKWRAPAGFPRSCGRPDSGGRLAPAQTPGPASRSTGWREAETARTAMRCEPLSCSPHARYRGARGLQNLELIRSRHPAPHYGADDRPMHVLLTASRSA
jgi:hypothetical protein